MRWERAQTGRASTNGRWPRSTIQAGNAQILYVYGVSHLLGRPSHHLLQFRHIQAMELEASSERAMHLVPPQGYIECDSGDKLLTAVRHRVSQVDYTCKRQLLHVNRLHVCE